MVGLRHARFGLLLALAACGEGPSKTPDSAREPSAPDRPTIAEASIRRDATTLPPARSDPHDEAPPGDPISGVVRTMLEDSQGRMWFGTQNGLFRLDDETLHHFDLRSESGHGLTVKALCQDGRGGMWIGTSDGVIHHDGKSFTQYFARDGLPSEDVWSLCVDRNGTVWAGTFAGVCRFDSGGFEAFPLPPSPWVSNRGVTSPTIVWSIAEDHSGRLWFAGEGLVHRFDGETVEPVSVMDEDSPTFVTAVLVDRRGDVWFATQDEGVIRFDGENFQNLARDQGGEPSEVNSLFEDRSGDLWFPVEGVGVLRFDGAQLHLLSAEEGLVPRAVFCVTQDHAGRIWFGGQRGVWRLEGSATVEISRTGPW